MKKVDKICQSLRVRQFSEIPEDKQLELITSWYLFHDQKTLLSNPQKLIMEQSIAYQVFKDLQKYYGTNVYSKLSTTLRNGRNKRRGFTALEYAAMMNNYEIVELLVENGAEPIDPNVPSGAAKDFMVFFNSRPPAPEPPPPPPEF
jgi:hypothetical protein